MLIIKAIRQIHGSSNGGWRCGFPGSEEEKILEGQRDRQGPGGRLARGGVGGDWLRGGVGWVMGKPQLLQLFFFFSDFFFQGPSRWRGMGNADSFSG